jgi:2',3'-cyclic-nucleotide 2'-phosphodiesterase (5'-nucleotidase family)
MTLLVTSRSAAATAALILAGTSAFAQDRIQILHASDLEGGVEAIGSAPNFAAIVQALENDAATQSVPSFLLSAGDNYIPGPFFSAAADGSVRTVLRNVLGNPGAREGVGRVDIAIMNVLGFDASAIGNHEFDAGTSIMREIVGTDIRDSNNDTVLDEARWLGAQFPYLSSNLDFAADGSLSGLFTPSLLPNTAFQGSLADLAGAAAAPKLARATTVTTGGVTIGVVGATTPIVATISSTGGVVVENPGAGTNDMALLAQIVQPQIDALELAGVNKIVLVSHLQQLALEQQLVPLLSGVDVVIAGGSDTLLADGTDVLAPGDVAAGAYPIVATNLDGEPTLIVSTAGEYSYVGRLVVDFDVDGVVVPGSVVAAESGAYASESTTVQALWGDLVAPFASGTKGDLVQQLVDAVRQVVIVKDGAILGRTNVFLEGRREFVRTEETNLGTLTATANLAVARQFDPTVVVSHKNGGGIRAAIGAIDGTTGELLPPGANPESGKLAGEISQLDVENALRFNNGLTLVTLTRQQLREVLEHAVAQSTPGATPGRFAQVGNIVFSFDPTLPVGARVRTAGIATPSYWKAGFLPVFVFGGVTIGEAPVRMVTLNFLADGGDGYPFPDFIAANPAFADRVDLLTAGLPAGSATFAAPGSEQDALAEYLLARTLSRPFDVAEKSAATDLRIQNLSLRVDQVVDVLVRLFRAAN